jgi:hypothetical protein
MPKRSTQKYKELLSTYEVAAKLYEAGFSYRNVSEKCGKSTGWAWYAIKKFNEANLSKKNELSTDNTK